MNFRSHTKEKIAEALEAGLEVWTLDTDSDGDDDVLVGTEEEVIRDILDYLGADELPGHYTLTRVYGEILEEETFTCCSCNEELPISLLHVAHDASDDFDYCESCFAEMKEQADEE